jgi:hypothetical protein
MRRFICLLVAMVMCGVADKSRGQTFVTLDDPIATGASPAGGTVAQGIDGSNIVGTYYVNQVANGFLYNGSSFTTIDVPTATSTDIRGISGSNIVGDYSNGSNHGFIYNGSTFTTLDDPVAVSNSGSTYAAGVDGTNVVGYFTYPGKTYGFLYNGSNYTTLSDPNAIFGTYAEDISGNTVVGYYIGNRGIQPFSYVNGVYSDINGLGSGANLDGIDGTDLSGNYQSASGPAGFYFDGTNFLTLRDPASSGNQTTAFSLSGNHVVGYYLTSDGLEHGFVATVPEPTTIGLAAISALMFTGRRSRRAR